MKIDHVAVWVDDLEGMKEFYLKYFDASCGEKYHNPKKNYTSYFISFDKGGSRIELMNRPDIADNHHARGVLKGWAHLSVSVGGKDAVDKMTERFRREGYVIESEPRTTGDGYYESGISDPEGNFIEITE